MEIFQKNRGVVAISPIDRASHPEVLGLNIAKILSAQLAKADPTKVKNQSGLASPVARKDQFAPVNPKDQLVQTSQVEAADQNDLAGPKDRLVKMDQVEAADQNDLAGPKDQLVQMDLVEATDQNDLPDLPDLASPGVKMVVFTRVVPLLLIAKKGSSARCDHHRMSVCPAVRIRRQLMGMTRNSFCQKMNAW